MVEIDRLLNDVGSRVIPSETYYQPDLGGYQLRVFTSNVKYSYEIMLFTSTMCHDWKKKKAHEGYGVVSNVKQKKV